MSRKLLIVHGDDACIFLNSIVTNDVKNLRDDELLYSLLLTPHGKLIHDFFIFKGKNYDLKNPFILDCYNDAIDNIIAIFQKYKLRSKVFFEKLENNKVTLKDPRHEKFGIRQYDNNIVTADATDKTYFDLNFPQLYRDFQPEQYFPFDLGYDKFNSISMTKGCYIGQEIITRTTFRGVIRKKIFKILIEDTPGITGKLENNTEIFSEGKKIGNLIGIYNFDQKLYGLAIINREKIIDKTSFYLSIDDVNLSCTLI